MTPLQRLIESGLIKVITSRDNTTELFCRVCEQTDGHRNDCAVAARLEKR